MTHTGHDGFRPYIDLPRPLILDSNIVFSVERDESSPVTWEFTIRLLERMADALAPVGQLRDEEPKSLRPKSSRGVCALSGNLISAGDRVYGPTCKVAYIPGKPIRNDSRADDRRLGRLHMFANGPNTPAHLLGNTSSLVRPRAQANDASWAKPASRAPTDGEKSNRDGSVIVSLGVA